MKDSLLFTALSFGSILGGIVVGSWMRNKDSMSDFYLLLIEIACILAAIGFLVSKVSARLFSTPCSTVCGGSVFYAAVLIAIVPVVGSITSEVLPIVVADVMLPIPLLLAMACQMRYREWFSVAGATVFLFAYYAAIAEHLYARHGVKLLF